MSVQKPLEALVLWSRHLSLSLAAMVPGFMLRRSFLYFVGITCVIVMLVYAFQPQFSTKEDYIEEGQVINYGDKRDFI